MLKRIEDSIPIYDKEGFAGMHKAGQLTATLLDEFVSIVKPGITTDELNTIALNFAKDNGAFPAPLYYRGFPKAICTSINHVICHGIPKDKKLNNGDIINIDVTLIKDGWHGDASRMYPVGDISVKARKLIDVTYQSLEKSIEILKPGVTLGDIGHVIQKYAEGQRCSVVRDFCGHGLGKHFHTPPSVLHYGQPGEGAALSEGMIFTIEPMINLGRYESKLMQDGWTAITKDRSLSAQFEHSLGITHNGVEIFTKSPKGWDNPLSVM